MRDGWSFPPHRVWVGEEREVKVRGLTIRRAVEPHGSEVRGEVLTGPYTHTEAQAQERFQRINSVEVSIRDVSQPVGQPVYNRARPDTSAWVEASTLIIRSQVDRKEYNTTLAHSKGGSVAVWLL